MYPIPPHIDAPFFDISNVNIGLTSICHFHLITWGGGGGGVVRYHNVYIQQIKTGCAYMREDRVHALFGGFSQKRNFIELKLTFEICRTLWSRSETFVILPWI